MNAEWLDGDGYPTDEALEKITKWPWEDIPGLFKFVEDIWFFAEDGYLWRDKEPLEEFGGVYQIWNLSTAGWSGNESIIDAMKQNFIIWSQTAYSWKRGGHHQFRLKVEK